VNFSKHFVALSADGPQPLPGAARLGVPWFRGSEGDVLNRFAGAAHAFNADVGLGLTR
jgi:spore coat polysaccharide biosynthesis protein SpsF (cytidylyltransferase family)